MSKIVFQINPNGSKKAGSVSNNVKSKTKNCKRPGGFLWGSRGLSCSC